MKKLTRAERRRRDRALTEQAATTNAGPNRAARRAQIAAMPRAWRLASKSPATISWWRRADRKLWNA